MPPRFGVQAPRCPRCEDRVYAAEQVIGPAGKAYHRACLKCIVCNKRLDSVTLLEHDGEPFCSMCHRKHLGQGTGGFGTAVPLQPQIDTRAAAETAQQRAVTASTSAPAVTQRRSSAVAPPAPAAPAQREAQAPGASATGSEAPGGRSVPVPPPEPPSTPPRLPSAASQPMPVRREQECSPSRRVAQAPPMLSGTPLCARCQKPVYFAEQKQASGRKWHRACLRCDGCSATLDPGKVQEGPQSEAYTGGANTWCRLCYAKVRTAIGAARLTQQHFGPRGIGVGGLSFPGRS